MQARRQRKRSNFLDIRKVRNLLLSSRFWQRCQCTQRLSKTVHRHDPDTVREAARLGCVFPSRDEKEVDSRAPNADRLLSETADGRHGAVELELSRRRDAAAVVDILPELLEHVERERQAGRRAADASGVDLHAARQLDERSLVDEDSDDRPAALLWVRDRPDDDLHELRAAADAELDRVTR